MRKFDIREALVWAAAAALMVAAGFSGTPVTSEDAGLALIQPEFETKGVRVSLGPVLPLEGGKVQVTFQARSAVAEAVEVSLDTVLLGRSFAGNPLSRVPLPTDFKTQELSTAKVTIRLPAGREASVTIEYPVAEADDEELRGMTFSVSATDGQKTVELAPGMQIVPIAGLHSRCGSSVRDRCRRGRCGVAGSPRPRRRLGAAPRKRRGHPDGGGALHRGCRRCHASMPADVHPLA